MPYLTDYMPIGVMRMRVNRRRRQLASVQRYGTAYIPKNEKP